MAAPAAAGGLDVPFFSQDELLCGGACAAMVMRYHGDLDARPGMFADLVDTHRGGIVADSLAARLRSLGWRARPVSGTAALARRHLADGDPPIALIASGPDRFHYVVVTEWGDSHVVVHDPADGPARPIDARAFMSLWAATQRWMLVATREPSPDGSVTARPAPSLPADTPCDSVVAAAVGIARRGGLDDARRRLTEVAARYPGCAAAHRELAGVYFRQKRWEKAAAAAQEACALDPRDRHARRLLASSLYLRGDRDQALREWNRIDEPRVGFVDIAGARRTRYRVVESALGLDRGELLTPRLMRRTRRRAASLPAARLSRVEYRIQRDMTAKVNVHLLERPARPGIAPLLVGEGARAATRRTVSLRPANLAGVGDAWALSARWWENRPAVWLNLAVPGGIAGGRVTRIEAGWERETVHLEATPETEEYRYAALGMDGWVGADTRVGVRAGYRSGTEGRHAGAGAEFEVRTPGDRLRATARADVWYRAGSGAVTGGAVGLGWRSAAAAPGPQFAARAGVAAVGESAPKWMWPGAGLGIARPWLLRAHPLLDGGVISGPAFDTALAHAGVEQRWWFPRLSLVRPGVAFFTDAARPFGARGAHRTLVDIGAGLRLALPAGAGHLCLDLAHSITDGDNAVSLVLRTGGER